MNTEPYVQLQTQLLARKAQLMTELEAVNTQLGQCAAVLAFAKQNEPKVEPEPAQ